MDPVVVVGAGMSGVACARTLTEAGLEVVVLDRGRQPGGRMATRHINERPVDIGASYFTVSDEGFAGVVRGWQARDLAHRWTDTFDVANGGVWGDQKSGNDRWAARLGLRSLVEDLAVGLDVRQRTVRAVTVTEGGLRIDHQPASALALAMPDPQARHLLEPGSAASVALGDPFEPVLALSAGWGQRRWQAGFDGAFINDDQDVAWVADDGRRRGDGASVLVAHSTPELAAAHLDDPRGAAGAMLAAVMRLLRIEEQPEWTDMQRWTFARPVGARTDTHYFGSENIGVCSDAWSERPRVEAAYLSGVALGRSITQSLS